MLNSNTGHNWRGVEVLVQGTVQGVGFRPFIYKLASHFEISGTVTNTSDGVTITATARKDRLSAFILAIEEQAPPLSRITSIKTRTLEGKIQAGTFTILPSVAGRSATAAIPPDIALCDDCLRELLDPGDNRHNYPFINCTNCGPRFTIVETIPYDRPKTSMKVFPMCNGCEKEYHDPANRRFHAQPNACELCGPQISLHDRQGTALDVIDPLAETVKFLVNDRIIAIRGLGGFHLVVNGCSNAATELLRKRKGRPDKPLAIMVADVAAAEGFCHLNSQEIALLSSPEHPIVLLRKAKSSLADNLAPGIEEVGVMLPYTPLHHLLFQQPSCPQALVMTSGNMSGAPICTANEDAVAKLGSIADFFLLHNRDIVTRVDDSVVKVVNNSPVIFRRARGYVPSPIDVAWKLPKILGCGAGLKSTFCLGRDKSAFPSQHIGDLDNLASYDFYLESVEHFKSVLQLEPEAVACDLHPDYMSSRYAAELGLPLYQVQHHHAHAVAVMAEHAIEEPVLAVVLDGTGLGNDGTIWGGEVLQTDLTSFKRLGHLSYLHLPGGDSAASQPWRVGLSALFNTFGPSGMQRATLPAPLKQLKSESVEVISTMLTNNFNCPPSSSCGRLFDGVASILGVRQQISYEGQAAMELEAIARKAWTSSWSGDIWPGSQTDFQPFLSEKNGMWEISSTELVKMVMNGVDKGDSIAAIGLQFHSLLIGSITKLVENLSQQTGIRRVMLSGGCMQNSLLFEGLFSTLKSIHLQVFTGSSLPVNDGAISFGQTIIGGLRHVSRNSNESNSSSG